MLHSFEVLSALFVATTVVQAVSISGDYVCKTNSGCSGELLDIASGTDFSLKCADVSSCEGSYIVVHSGCALNSGGIDCSPQFACRNAQIDVYSSDLAMNENRYLKCYNSVSGGACKDMNMFLTDSNITLYCGSNDCDYMRVLFGSSMLELKPGTECSTTPSKALTIYLYDSSQLIDNGVIGYTLVTNPPTTTTTMTPTSTTQLPTTTTMTPTMTTTLIPSTSTLTPSTTRLTTPLPSTPIPQTTRPIPNSTKTTQAKQSTTETLVSTKSDSGGGNDGSSNFLDAIMFVAIGAGGVLLLVGVFCLGKYSGKQEQGENKKDAKAQIALVPRTQSQDSDQLSESIDNAVYGQKWVVAEDRGEEQTTEGQMDDGNPDAVPSPEVSLEIMFMDMPKNHTPGGHLPQSPEGCRRQVEGGAYGTR